MEERRRARRARRSRRRAGALSSLGIAAVSVALGIAAGSVVLAACGLAPSARGPTTSVAGTTTSTAATSTTPEAAGTTTTAVPPATTTTTASTATPSVLMPGARGPAVEALQRRLAALGYWLGDADGVYGAATMQAVTALQKAAGLARDGAAGPATAQALAGDVRPMARSTSGRVVEVDLDRQLVLVVTDGHVDAALDASTGSGETYVTAGGTARAVTPTGRFAVFRQVDGADVSPLGVLWRPKYFTGGIALHGYAEVPPYPASHGCVRVGMAAMDWLWSQDLVPVGTEVLVY